MPRLGSYLPNEHLTTHTNQPDWDIAFLGMFETFRNSNRAIGRHPYTRKSKKKIYAPNEVVLTKKQWSDKV